MERARNVKRLPHLGDPERWGGQETVNVNVIAGGPVAYEVAGQQFIRAQLSELLAVTWDLTCIFSSTGIDTTDTVDYYLRYAFGTGQASVIGYIDILEAAALGTPWRKTVNGSVVTGWGISLPTPIPGCAVAIAPVVKLTTAGTPVANRNVAVDFFAFISPRSTI